MNVMFKLATISLVILSTILSAQVRESDPFAELDMEIKADAAEGGAQDMAEFQAWKESYLDEYQKFRVEHFGRLDDFRDQLLSTWGEAEVTEQSKYVEYSEDNTTKTVFDFEKNEIRVSVLHDKDVELKVEVATQALAKVIEKNTAEATPETPSMMQSIAGPEIKATDITQLVAKAQIQEEPAESEQKAQQVLQQEIKLIAKQTKAQEQDIEKAYDLMESKNSEVGEPKGEMPSKVAIVAEGKAEQEAKEKEAKIKAEYEKIKQQEAERLARLKKQATQLQSNTQKRAALTNKKITTYTIPLKSQKDAARAQPYLSRVQEQSKRFKLNPSLVFAVIHTESHFNPKAQSHIPAYGLMQIVPRTAGRDVNRFLFKLDEDMPAEKLYIADDNIEAGAAYLHILLNRYLRKIDNPQSLLYCAIAAYNTGSGNVAKTFNTDGSRNISKAAKIINAMTPEEVYAKLIANLPYEETRNYLKKIEKRRPIYTFADPKEQAL
jgi:membrane-bound lytic murein transglycosylase C